MTSLSIREWMNSLRGQSLIPCVIAVVATLIIIIISGIVSIEWVFNLLSTPGCGYTLYIYNWSHCVLFTLFYGFLWVIGIKELFFYQAGVSSSLFRIFLILFFLKSILFSVGGIVLLFFFDGCASLIEYRLFMVILICSLVACILFAINFKKLI